MQFSIYKNLRYSLIFAFIFLVGCESAPVKTGIWKDKEIPAEKAEKLRQLNTDLSKAIKTDRSDAELLLSKQYLTEKNLKVQFDYINKLRSGDEYYLLKDYYIVNQGTNEADFKVVDNPEVKYTPLAKEMYIACFIPKNNPDKTMLTIVYGKYDIGWKANHIALGYYTQMGQTSTQLFEAAKADYAKGYLVNAINNIILAQNCMSGSAYLKAANGEDIKSFAKSIVDEANAKFNYPMMISGVNTQPAIFSISSNVKGGELTQYVYYLTKLKITDSAAVRQENDQVKKHLSEVFPGIDEGKKTMYYSAMNQKPIVGERVDHLDFEEKINN